MTLAVGSCFKGRPFVTVLFPITFDFTWTRRKACDVHGMRLGCALQISTSWHFELCFLVTQTRKETRTILEEAGGEQSGAAEACWAHNPEVDGSKPSAATYFFR